MQGLIIFAEALVMLFELRFLLQASGADYYSPITQAVLKLTAPVMRPGFISRMYIGRLPVGALVIALVLSLAFWQGLGWYIHLPVLWSLKVGALMFVKTAGYLILILLLVQALTSWLPSTRHISFLMAQLTSPVVAPVQRIIPPIGMIDISLMIVMIAIFAINRLCYSLFGMAWAII